MKKLVNISIGGLAFQAEEDAYARLENYLSRIRGHFSGVEGAEEIASDIEARLGEQFEAAAGRNGILTLPAVEALLKTMGEPGEFGPGGRPAPEERPQAPAAAPAVKRLMRDRDEVVISGVCGGVAAYIGADPVWVRLAFALSVFFGGFGVILYLILWMIMPEARTSTEKMQMRGDPINLKGIERTLKERTEEFKSRDQGRLRRALTAPFRALGVAGAALGRACGRVGPLLLKALGVCILVAGSLAIAALLVAAISAAFNANSPYVDLPLRGLAAGPLFYTGVASAFFTAFVPLLFLALLGAALLAGRPVCGKLCSISLLVLWVAALATLANVAIKYAPRLENAYNDMPGYRAASRQLKLADFSRIKLGPACQAAVYPSKTYKVTASGSELDLEELTVVVENGVLTAGRKKESRLILFRRRGPVRLEIYLPKLEEAELSGAARLTAEGFEARELALRLSGASRAALALKAQQLRAELSGASALELSGAVAAGEFKASGASRIRAEEAQLSRAEVDLSGGSRARFGSLLELSGEAGGASEIALRSAVKKDVALSGASRIRED